MMDRIDNVFLENFQNALNEFFENIDRFEVIDKNGRSYVKGSIYGSPVKIEALIQDNCKTLKIVVKDR